MQCDSRLLYCLGSQAVCTHQDALISAAVDAVRRLSIAIVSLIAVSSHRLKRKLYASNDPPRCLAHNTRLADPTCDTDARGARCRGTSAFPVSYFSFVSWPSRSPGAPGAPTLRFPVLECSAHSVISILHSCIMTRAGEG